jgi:ectoine hydroxylase-related dioxygenase (phytanoyl-CoA dioxygenase family)
LFEQEIKDRQATITTHLPERGDVLLWHSRLLHRGSIANTPGLMRKSLIAHYSGINHRQDMLPAVKHGGGYYFPVDDGLRSMA